jgi:MFS family permease
MLWMTNVVSLMGTLMHDVGAAWLMTTLAPTPFMVAMVQTASTLPFFLLALPAGALADIIDRRRLLLMAQIWMLVASVVLGVLTLSGMTTPLVLLALTFFLALGAAVNGPSWQAIIPELVERSELSSAIALGSVGFNLARAVGPVIGGLIVAAFGPGVTFLLNGASFLGVVVVLKKWKRAEKTSTLKEERLVSAMRAGIRYIRHAPEVRSVLIHSLFVSFFCSSLPALLPIISKKYLGLGSSGFGILLGFFGFGALLGAPFLPVLRQRFSLNVIVLVGANLFALATAVIANLHSFLFIAIAMVAAGMAWLILISTLIAVVQSVIPSWVRGRVLSVHMLSFFGGLAGGSALFGLVAGWIGIPSTLNVVAGCLVATTAITWNYKLKSGEELDLRPSMHWPSLVVSCQPDFDEGPVLVVVEYNIDPAKATGFTDSMQALKTIRRRDGAIRWNLFHDLTDPGHYIESYIVESWGEHLRQHERITVADREIEKNALSFNLDGKPPKVMHFLAEPLPVKNKKPDAPVDDIKKS